MALLIQTTGLEDYAPGGTARIKVLNIGGPGSGKTRWSSYFPKPIFADCEKGRASIADRKMPYVDVKSSQDMLDLLAMLKQECAQPAAQRRFDTIVIDTLDAYQRKIKNEWMEKEGKQTFTGWEAWGYLNSRMQTLMTRLLNLDMNVIVNVHYKDKTTKDDETGRETHALMLQLQGETADTAYNDFDLVGWTGVYWEAVDGERIQKRGITFKPTPDKPFLKDRLHVTPPWLEITFSPNDYDALFDRIQAKVAQLEASEVVGEVPSEQPEVPANVVAPGQIGTGAITGADSAVNPGDPTKVPYRLMDKPTLAKLCRDRNIGVTVTGTPMRGNTLKSELIAALEQYDREGAVDDSHDAGDTAEQATNSPDPAHPAAAETTTAGDFPETERAEPEPPAQSAAASAPSAPTVPVQLQRVEQGVVDTATGELKDESPSSQPASAPAQAEEPKPQPELEPERKGPVCSECGKDLSGENPDFVKLAWIKYRKRLCEADYDTYKNR